MQTIISNSCELWTSTEFVWNSNSQTYSIQGEWVDIPKFSQTIISPLEKKSDVITCTVKNFWGTKIEITFFQPKQIPFSNITFLCRFLCLHLSTVVSNKYISHFRSVLLFTSIFANLENFVFFPAFTVIVCVCVFFQFNLIRISFSEKFIVERPLTTYKFSWYCIFHE